MNRDEVIQAIRERFAEDVIHVFDRSAKRLYIEIKAQAIVQIAEYIYKELGARFNIASGVDERDHMEILYHFILEDINLLLSLRVTLAKSKLEIDSLTTVFTAAHWIEREIHELLGVNFIGHPDLKRLLLSEEWPQGVYPLRKDYQEWAPDAIRDRGV
jgi:Ni,Fe-hydrogenase III component G